MFRRPGTRKRWKSWSLKTPGMLGALESARQAGLEASKDLAFARRVDPSGGNLLQQMEDSVRFLRLPQKSGLKGHQEEYPPSS